MQAPRFNHVDLATSGLQLEYCCRVRKLTEDDARPQLRFKLTRKGETLPA